MTGIKEAGDQRLADDHQRLVEKVTRQAEKRAKNRAKKKARQAVIKRLRLNIHQRISAVQADVTKVDKSARINNQYDAVSHDDVTKMLRPLFVKHGIISTLSQCGASMHDTGGKTGNGRPIMQMRAQFMVTYISTDDPSDKLGVQVEAHADDSGDKAPGKVMSYAQKYADMKTFRIQTGENDEARVEAVAEPTLAKEHLTALYLKAEEIYGKKADEKLGAMADKIFQVRSYALIPDKYFGVAMAKLESNPAKKAEV